MPTPRRFVLLDRDGTVIVERNYLSDPAQVELLPGVAQALRELSAAGLGLILVTNQSGIGRGYFTSADFQAVQARLAELLAAGNVRPDAVYHCPHAPSEPCVCRKPAPGMILQAAADFGFDPARSFVIGDKPCDVELGRAVGATTFLVRSGYGAAHAAEGYDRADHVTDDLPQAAAIILKILADETEPTPNAPSRP